jgi:long-chain fatty acid transport protein
VNQAFASFSVGTWAIAVTFSFSAAANGLNRDGVGARSMAIAGADAASGEDPLSSMGLNPAGLVYAERPELGLGFIGGFVSGHYEKGFGIAGRLDESFRALPEAALALPIGDRFALGMSFVPDSLLLAEWNYVDAPGGLNGTTSYGQQEHRSELVLLRSAFGAAIRLHPAFALGASIGLLYNENRLDAPYIFQDLHPSSAAAVNGAKTLLDLQTSGFGWNVQIGALYSPLTNLQFGFTYKTEAKITSHGDANGDPYAQFGVAPGPLAFHYDASVENTFPQEITGAVSWKFHARWRLSLQVDWQDWSDAFQSLPVHLENGSNPAVNGVLGSNVRDLIPLDWKDRFVYRAGLEHEIADRFFLRAGYAYGRSPVPNATLTPLTAVIMEHMVSAGIGYAAKSWGLDLAWQYDLPVTREIGASRLRAGEYSDSSVRVNVHRIALTGRYRF